MKTIIDRFKAMTQSKTMEELRTNQELFELHAKLDHQIWLREHAEKQVKFYQRLSELHSRLDAVLDGVEPKNTQQ